MTKILSPGAACVIPETLSGLPVTELGDKALAQTGVEEVFLPRTLRRLGRELTVFMAARGFPISIFMEVPLRRGEGFAACGRCGADGPGSVGAVGIGRRQDFVSGPLPAARRTGGA